MDYQEIFQHLPVIGRFALIFGLIVILPKLSERAGFPGVLGLLIGGILLGPNLLGLLNPKGQVIQLFSELGKLLLMFFAGFEVNLELFRKVAKRSAGFGFLTFAIPMLTGTGVGLIMEYSLNASILIGSLMASHTLMGLPIVKTLGLTNHDASVITVGATIFTDIFSMLVLAICLSIHVTGFSGTNLAISLLELAVYVPLVIFGLSWVAKKLFRWNESEEMRFAILILMIALASLLAEMIELEGIVGAFLTGIAVNRALGEHHQSGQTLAAVSQSLFIPVFFLSTGFLVDFKIFGNTITQHYGMVILVVGGLLVAKYAARSAGAIYQYGKNDALFMWSLTIPQVAATLAAAIVAYDTRNDEGVRLLSEPMLNAVVVLVVVTSVAGPMLTKKFGSRMIQQPISS
jgi:Kef-type K+ transport system membrane component KefB